MINVVLSLIRLFLFCSLLVSASLVYAINNGDILVIDDSAGTGGLGALYVVNPATGDRTILSDFGNAGQGPLGYQPFGIAVAESGNILVADWGGGSNGALFVVNPSTGARTILSDFGNAGQGPLGADPIGVAVNSSGTIYVIDYNAGTSNNGALFVVNPTTGNRTILSDFGNAGQGPLATQTYGVAVDGNGNILVVDLDYGTFANGGLFVVNPTTGNRTVLSDFGNAGQGSLGYQPFGVAVAASGNILVIDDTAGTGGLGALFVVNPATGDRTILSDFGNAGQGLTGRDPEGLKVDAAGNILVVDPQAGTRTP